MSEDTNPEVHLRKNMFPTELPRLIQCDIEFFDNKQSDNATHKIFLGNCTTPIFVRISFKRKVPSLSPEKVDKTALKTQIANIFRRLSGGTYPVDIVIETIDRSYDIIEVENSFE